PERQVADLQLVARRANGIHHAAVKISRERPFDGAFEPESLPKVGLFHRGQSNCTPRPPRTASRTRCTCQPSRNVAGSPWGVPPPSPISCTISRNHRTNERAHM